MKQKMKDFYIILIIELVGIIVEYLQKYGIEVVLVGGFVVEVYIENFYFIKDIDMVNINYWLFKYVYVVMVELGFFKQGWVYVNIIIDIIVEFLIVSFFVGDELIKSIIYLYVVDRCILILKVEDVVKDCLVVYIYWQDWQLLI